MGVLYSIGDLDADDCEAGLMRGYLPIWVGPFLLVIAFLLPHLPDVPCYLHWPSYRCQWSKVCAGKVIKRETAQDYPSSA